MNEIHLTKRENGLFEAKTFEDGQILFNLDCPVCFSEDEYDDILTKVSNAGYWLSTEYLDEIN